MGHAFNESYVEFGSTRKINFCNKLFTAWDFNITDPKTAKLRQAHIRTDFHVIMININMCAIFFVVFCRRSYWIYRLERRSDHGRSFFLLFSFDFGLIFLSF